MSDRHTVHPTLCDHVPSNVEAAINVLTDIVRKHKQDHAYLILDTKEYYGNTRIVVTGSRKENDEEYTHRINCERKKYERLKKKFGGEIDEGQG